ncbi:hypothetical protein [Sporichthya polymorpha]|uniref:hypothetical protein n=1 Tax=Sporichthya polymorpha TaxID=35751 RepID=UPI0003711B1D|nr:hypothetical protein [Sporichthya polymorpha]
MAQTDTPHAAGHDSATGARAAAERLHAALDAHLAAVEARESEHDPAVQQAYKELRAAAAEYDVALYTEHDEVTPFDLPDLDGGDDHGAEVISLERLSLVARWDFSVVDPATLTSVAEQAVGESVPDVAVGLAALVAALGHTQIGTPETVVRMGLQPHGFATWVLATDDADPGEDDPAWMADPFAGALPERALCRLESPVEPDDEG